MAEREFHRPYFNEMPTMTIPTAYPLKPTAKCGLCNRDLYSWMTVTDCKNEPHPAHCPMRRYDWETEAWMLLNEQAAPAPAPAPLGLMWQPVDYDRSLEQQQEAANSLTPPKWLVGPGPSVSGLIAFAAAASVIGGFVFFYFWLFH